MKELHTSLTDNIYTYNNLLTIKKSTNKIILIDTSNYIINTFYETLTIFKKNNYNIFISLKKNNQLGDYDWINNSIFKNIFDKQFITKLNSVSNYEINLKPFIIFCNDAPSNTLWRKNIYSDYKLSKNKIKKKKYNLSQIFNYVYTIIKYNFIQLKINELEADDIIATVCKIYNCLNSHIHIYIVSDDTDFLQLGRNNVFFINSKKNIFQLSSDQAKQLLHKKIINGDNSDNIKSIIPYMFDNNIYNELLISIENFNQYINTNNKIYEKYRNNQLLIDFNYIPNKYYLHILLLFSSLRA